MKIAFFATLLLSASAMATPTNGSEWLNCTKTDAYRAYKLQYDVIAPRDTIVFLQQELAQERRISAVAGVRNLTKEYDLGKQLVQARDDLKYFWTVYKEAGGKAKKPNDLPKDLDDPCEGLSVNR